jgi:hypothetical protein
LKGGLWGLYVLNHIILGSRKGIPIKGSYREGRAALGKAKSFLEVNFVGREKALFVKKGYKGRCITIFLEIQLLAVITADIGHEPDSTI